MPIKSFFAECDNLPIIRKFVEVSVQELGAKSSVECDFVQAIDEAVTNIIMHGYEEKFGTIEIEIKLQNDLLIVYLRDQAKFFDPTEVPSPDLTKPLEERTPGGCGVYLMKFLMDEIKYRPLFPKGNELTLVKSVL